MHPFDPRPARRTPNRFALVLALAAAASLASPLAAAPDPARHPDRLVVLSTTDVKGKTSPCGCHVPKGGFARRAAFADSIRSAYDHVLLVDNGGWFPESADSLYRDVAEFQAGELVRQRADAVGIGERELAFGPGFLRDLVARTGVRAVCANLFEPGGRRPLLPQYRIVQSGALKVGVFSLVSDKVELGAQAGAVLVTDPVASAKQVVDLLRGKGVNAIVLLSNLGKVESEDLVTAVEGIDAVIVGHNVPLLQVGRRIRNTVANYGGEQGHYIGMATLVLDARGHVADGADTTYVLGPEVHESPEALARVKAFEDGFNARLKQRDKARTVAAEAATAGTDSVSHYLGAEVCARCHPSQYAQWKSTPHAQAWQALVDSKHADAGECASCHTVGWRRAGGFRAAEDAQRLGDVQCESCHGMGTEHAAWPGQHATVPEATCRTCHTRASSPGFAMDTFRPHVLHAVPAALPPLPPRAKFPERVTR